MKFGIPAEREWGKLVVTPTQEWGIFTNQSKYELALKNINKDFDIAYCPIVSTSGEVLLNDQEMHPVLIRQKHGKGQVYFSAYPLEMISLGDPDNSADNLLQSLYTSLWQIHGSYTKIHLTGKDLEYGIWRNMTKNQFKVKVLNHEDEERHGTLTLPFVPVVDTFPTSVIINSQNEIEFFLSAKNTLIMDLHTVSDNKVSSVSESDSGLRR